MSKKCFGYIRVSTVKQGEGVSLEAQKDAITAFAAKNDLTISQWFEEKETAAKKGRPVFGAMIRDLKKGKAQGLVVHKIDRSARNFSDWAKIGDLADLGIDIHFATESLDFRSRGGRLAADIQAVVAADYVRNLRDETIKGLNGRLKQGIYPFRAPVGYLDNGGGRAKTIDPVQGPLVRKLYELYASGAYSIRSLQVEMHRRGLRSRNGGPVTKTGIETILRNPFYIGLIAIRRTGKTFDGIHAPLITPSLYEAVQARKQGRAVKKQTRHNFIYRGLFRCGLCQGAMIPERQKGHVYYRCHTKACATKTVRERALEQHVIGTLAALTIAPGQRNAFDTELEQKMRATHRRMDEKTGAANLGQISAKLDRLTDALISGTIDQDIYRAKHRDLMIEKAALEDQQRQQADTSQIEATLRKFLELAKNLAALYEIALPTEKRQIVELATSNRVVNAKYLNVSPHSWLSDALEMTGCPLVSLFRGHKSKGGAVSETQYCGPENPDNWQEMTSLTDILTSISERASGGGCPEPDTDVGYELSSELETLNG